MLTLSTVILVAIILIRLIKFVNVNDEIIIRMDYKGRCNGIKDFPIIFAVSE